MLEATIPNSKNTLNVDFDRWREGVRELCVLASKMAYDKLPDVIELAGEQFEKDYYDGSFAIYATKGFAE